jgi:hypothetical protein
LLKECEAVLDLLDQDADKGALSIAKAKPQVAHTMVKQSLGSVLLLAQSAAVTTA